MPDPVKRIPLHAWQQEDQPNVGIETIRARPRQIAPTSGVVKPATQSSSVVFPDPDAPNRMVNPGTALNSTSSENSRSADGKLLRIRAVRVGLAVVCFRWRGHRRFAYLTGPIFHAF